MKQQSVMHNFAVNPDVQLPRSQFNMPFGHKFTGDAGWLIPAYWQMVLPGDTLNVDPTIFARMSTPIFPIMDNMFLDIQHFFVPTRILWDNYRKFHGEQNNPGDSISFTIPKLSGGTTSDADGNLLTINGRVSILMNYLGIPESISPTVVNINADLFRAYNSIYTHWFRDQNLINRPLIHTNDGPDPVGDYLLQRRGKRFDYFTQALPSPQRGSAVSLPLGISAPVTGTILGSNNEFRTLTSGAGVTRTMSVVTNNALASGADGNLFSYAPNNPVGGTELIADLTAATSATINDIREAQQVQKLLERDARSGTRLPEVLRAHYGVTNFYDASYRPEFLGGGSTSINMSQVAATNQSATVNQGDLAAYGTAVSSGKGFTKSFTEHGLVMSIISVRADLTYQQGLNRFFSHQTRYDVAYPILANLGEQAILSKEIFCDGTAGDEDVFGYVPRYDEYRFNISRISGKFLSASAVPLDSWHLSQQFATRPTLGQTFIEENPPLSRVVAVVNEPHFIFDTFFDIKCARVLPTYGIPGQGGTL